MTQDLYEGGPQPGAAFFTAKSILVVCLGNICRSPTAHAILHAKAPHLIIDSAGLGSWHAGDPPYPPMIAAAEKYGIDLTPLRARAVVPRDAADFDVILAADQSVSAALTARNIPNHLLAPFAGTGLTDIPDPYYTKDFDGAFKLIQAACDGLIAQLQ